MCRVRVFRWFLSGTAFAPPKVKQVANEKMLSGVMRHRQEWETRGRTGFRNIFGFLGVTLHHPYENMPVSAGAKYGPSNDNSHLLTDHPVINA